MRGRELRVGLSLRTSVGFKVIESITPTPIPWVKSCNLEDKSWVLVHDEDEIEVRKQP